MHSQIQWFRFLNADILFRKSFVHDILSGVSKYSVTFVGHYAFELLFMSVVTVRLIVCSVL